eukprot:m.93042 g.93042  ORF g.93042 m.93042 type:complete len:356 (-) comp12099_c0_seq3:51-1118(-)
MSVRRGLIEDYALLLREFTQQPGGSFAHFAEVWHRLRFGCVHAAWAKDQSQYTEMLLELFPYVAQFVDSKLEVGIRLCAIYTLFAVFKTQVRFPEAADAVVRIRVTPATWRHLKQLYASAAEENVFHDAAGAIQTLCRDDAFVFAAAPLHRRDEPITTAPILAEKSLHLVWGAPILEGAPAQSTTPLSSVSELDFPTDLATQYRKAKREVWTTELAEAGLDLVAVDDVDAVAGELPASLSHAALDHSENVRKHCETHVSDRAKRLRTVLLMTSRPHGNRRAVFPSFGAPLADVLTHPASTNFAQHITQPVAPSRVPARQQSPPSPTIPLEVRLEIQPRILEEATVDTAPLSMPDF